MIILERGVCQIVTSQEYIPFVDYGYLCVSSDVWRIKTYIDTFSLQSCGCLLVVFIDLRTPCYGAFFKNNPYLYPTFSCADEPFVLNRKNDMTISSLALWIAFMNAGKYSLSWSKFTRPSSGE